MTHRVHRIYRYIQLCVFHENGTYDTLKCLLNIQEPMNLSQMINNHVHSSCKVKDVPVSGKSPNFPQHHTFIL